MNNRVQKLVETAESLWKVYDRLISAHKELETEGLLSVRGMGAKFVEITLRVEALIGEIEAVVGDCEVAARIAARKRQMSASRCGTMARS